jgi:hypothetical protein
MSLQLNPTVSDAYDTKTLAEMRQMVFDALGFMPQMKVSGGTLSSFRVMRLEIMARLGLATALLGSVSTLANVRTMVTNELGLATALVGVVGTLGFLRAAVSNELGLATALVGSTSTLGAVRTMVSNELGLSVAVPVVTSTVGVVRNWLYNELGYGAMSVVPPGVIGLLNGFINEAIQTLFAKIELDEGTATRPTAIVATDTSQDAVSTFLDYTPVLQLATGLAKNHYGHEDAPKYFEQVEKYLADLRERTPANITKTLNQYINNAQQTIFARIESDKGGVAPPALLVSDGDATVVDTTVLVQLASALAKAHYNKPDAKIYLEEFERYMADITNRTPPNITATLNRIINDAQQTIFARIEMDKGGISAPAIMGSDGDAAVIDNAVLVQLATAMAKAHYNKQDAKVYLDQFERYMSDLTQRAPPSITKILNQIINQAQQTIFARIEYDQGGTFTTTTPSILNSQTPNTPPALLVSDGDATTVDTTVLVQLATALAKAHYSKPEAKAYAEEFERYMKDLTDRMPPNIVNVILSNIADAQRTVARRYEVGLTDISSLTFGATDASQIISNIDPEPVYLLALANLKKKVGQPDADAIYTQFEHFMADLYKRTPPQATTLVNRLLKQAQDLLYRRYKVFRMERWYTWTTVAGIRFYGINNDDEAQLSPPVGVTVTAGSATTAGNLNTARFNHTATLLPDGRLLHVGGQGDLGSTIGSAELFDPATGLFTYTSAPLAHARWGHTANLLSNGTVLVCGGQDAAYLNYCEIYNAQHDTFTAASSLINARNYHVAITLIDGRVLVAGGGTNTLVLPAELFNPSTGLFTTTGALAHGRFSPAAALLADGKVMLAGGVGATERNDIEIYDPSTGVWTVASGTLSVSREQAAAVRMGNGKVLIAGGFTGAGTSLAACDIYDPATGLAAATGSLSTARGRTTLNLLPNGKIIAIGGLGNAGSLTSAELFDPVAGTWSAVPVGMSDARTEHTAVYSPSTGKVYVVGGAGNTTLVDASAEMYDYVANDFSYTNGMTEGTDYYKVVAYTEGGVEIVGGIVTTISPGHTTALANVVGTGSIDAAGVMTIASVTNGAYAVGQIVTGTGVLAGTSIVKQLTGTAGGAGTYQLSALHAVVSTTLSAAVITGVPANTSVIVSWTPLIDSRVINYGVFGRTQGAEQLIALVPGTQTSYEDLGTITPSGALPTTNTTGSYKRIDPREITWCGVSQGDDSWRALIKGIPPEIYSTVTNGGVPQRYELRDAIEVWPEPRDSNWLIRMKGFFQPRRFELDADINSIDWQAIYLQAVADAKTTLKVNGKPMFSQYEVQQAQAELKTYIGDLVAGTHGTRRYIPGDRIAMNAIRPILLDTNGNVVN